MAESRDGDDGEALALTFAQAINDALTPLLMAAEFIAHGGPFALRRAIDLATTLLAHSEPFDGVISANDEPGARRRPSHD